MELTPFDPAADAADLARLCSVSLPQRWRPNAAGLGLLRRGRLARVDGRVVGAVAEDRAIQLLVVDPGHRRRGVGSALLRAALADVAAVSGDDVPLGSGGRHYLWPGVPVDLPEAVAFFSHHGCAWGPTVVDLVADVGRLIGRLDQRREAPAVRIGGLEPGDRAGWDEVLAFVAEHFPDWLLWYTDPADVVVGRDDDGSVVAALIRNGPGSAQVFWPVLGADAGWIGCVGVRPDRHGRGVGSALVAAASADLARAGVGRCQISWVERVAFYERVGYDVWAEYATGRLPGATTGPRS